MPIRGEGIRKAEGEKRWPYFLCSNIENQVGRPFPNNTFKLTPIGFIAIFPESSQSVSGAQ